MTEDELRWNDSDLVSLVEHLTDLPTRDAQRAVRVWVESVGAFRHIDDPRSWGRSFLDAFTGQAPNKRV